MKNSDNTLPVLCWFTLVFAAVTLAVAWMWPQQGQLFTLFSGQMTGFAGALLMYLRGKTPPTPGDKP